MSSSSDRFIIGGGAAGDGAGDHQEQLLLQSHRHHFYHVPQHSRREKLRFPPEESPPPPTPTQPSPSLLFLHDANSAAGSTFYHTTSLAPSSFPLSSSSSSSSSSFSSSYYSPNPTFALAPASHFFGHDDGALSIQPHHHHQNPNGGFSLSLSSQPTAAPPPPTPAASASRQLLSSRPAPLGPFTGYATVLSRSRFLEPARKLLDEVCDVGHRAAAAASASGETSTSFGVDADKDMLMDSDPPELSPLSDQGAEAQFRKENCDQIPSTEQQWKKTRLVSMLDEILRRYKQYYQQVQSVVSSFEAVAGLNNAAPFASMALKAMSKHFRLLKNMICDQLRQTNKVLGKESCHREDISSFGLQRGSGYFERATNYNEVAFGKPHVWRPQRGLPERAVAVLRAWLFEHFLHPYPTDSDKQVLAKQTGLTRNQVSNWFINARVRLWKPMVEEIHSLELRQKNKVLPSENVCNKDEQAQLPSTANTTGFTSEAPHFASLQENHCPVTKNIHEELIHVSNNIQEPLNFIYSNMPSHEHVGVGLTASTSSGVSLTLGLHHENGLCFSEPLPLNVARRFGLEDCNDPYVVNTYGGQERLFGKDVSGRLLHDFVG